VTGRGGHDMGPGPISVRRTDEDASWERQAFLPASRYILGMRVDATSYQDATERVIGWARRSESRYVCVAAVNNVMQVYDDEDFRKAMNRADLVTPDWLWMAGHEGRFGAVLVGVGAAFDFLAGVKRQALRVLQNAGLEWLFRLATEPKRLLKRYLGQNPRFALLFSAQLVRAHLVRFPSFPRKETH
jgi:UDP-N-acetyl-D-mannosaminuronic acid transferase (WecB/TagA/CpsF family)